MEKYVAAAERKPASQSCPRGQVVQLSFQSMLQEMPDRATAFGLLLGRSQGYWMGPVALER